MPTTKTCDRCHQPKPATFTVDGQSYPGRYFPSSNTMREHGCT